MNNIKIHHAYKGVGRVPTRRGGEKPDNILASIYLVLILVFLINSPLLYASQSHSDTKSTNATIANNIEMEYASDSTSHDNYVSESEFSTLKKELIALKNEQYEIGFDNLNAIYNLIFAILMMFTIIVTVLAFYGWSNYKKHIEEQVNKKTKRLDAYYENLIGRDYLSMRDYKEAEKHFENALTIDKNNYEALLKLGFIYLDQYLNIPKLAIKYSEKAILCEPSKIEPRLNLIVAKIHANENINSIMKSYDEFIEVSSKVEGYELAKGKVENFIALTKINRKFKDHESILKHLENAIPYFEKMIKDISETSAFIDHPARRGFEHWLRQNFILHIKLTPRIMDRKDLYERCLSSIKRVYNDLLGIGVNMIVDREFLSIIESEQYNNCKKDINRTLTLEI